MTAFHIHANNVNGALEQGLKTLATFGVKEDSRNGPVLVAPGPVLTTYRRSWERVLFSPVRDANPFFHLFEAIWMMAGHNDLDWPLRFNSRFAGYSDDGRALRGAYGFRWRKFFGFDQLPAIVAELKDDPNSRRAVLGMWSPGSDLHQNSKDIPCNTQVYFDLRGGDLNATVTCRSNDILWGAYGANAVHFSVLQEWLATALKVPVGEMRQFSNNFHLYTDVLPASGEGKTALSMADDSAVSDLYTLDGMEAIPLVGKDPWNWLIQAAEFCKFGLGMQFNYADPFFAGTARPMLQAWEAHKAKDHAMALHHAQNIVAPDWREAAVQWLVRRTPEGAAHV